MLYFSTLPWYHVYTMATVKIEPNYKVSIPKEARDAFDLHIGEELEVTFRRMNKTYTPTASERRAIEKGREEIKKGNYYTLDEFRTYLAGDTHKKARTKKSQTRTKA